MSMLKSCSFVLSITLVLISTTAFALPEGYQIETVAEYPSADLGAATVAVERSLAEEGVQILRPKWEVGVLCTLGSAGSIVYIYVSILLLNRAWGG